MWVSTTATGARSLEEAWSTDQLWRDFTVYLGGRVVESGSKWITVMVS